MSCTNGTDKDYVGFCLAGWGSFGLVTLLLLVTITILIITCYKCYSIKKQLKKRKEEDPQISYPTNIQQVHSPWGTGEEALSEVREQRAGEASNETQTVTQEIIEEESEQHSQEDQTSVRYLETVNLKDQEERDKGAYVLPTGHLIQSQGSDIQRSMAAGYRDFSGSVSSTRCDYRDSLEGWAPHRHRGQSPLKSESPQHTTQLALDGAGTEEYIPMNSVVSSNVFFTPMASMGLRRIMEDNIWEQREEETLDDDDNIVTNPKIPADYEDPVPSQTVGNTRMGDPNPLLGHNGPTDPHVSSKISDTPSNTYDNSKVHYNRYINLNVISSPSLMPSVYTSDTQPVSQQDSQPRQQSLERASVESEDEEDDDDMTEEGTARDRHPYVNIDGAFLPPEPLIISRRPL